MGWRTYVQDKTPTQIDSSADGNTVYLRWTDKTVDEIVRRITTASNGSGGTLTTIADSFGLWTNRASLTYTAIQMGGR
jgi:hypothetical protein